MSMVYPLSLFLFAIPKFPRPYFQYWVVMLGYTVINIVIKYIMQFPVICYCHDTSNDYLKWEPYCTNNAARCSSSDIPSDLLHVRWPYMLGIAKLDGAFIHGIWVDLMTLIVLLAHKYIMIARGQWKCTEKDPKTGKDVVKVEPIYKSGYTAMKSIVTDNPDLPGRDYYARQFLVQLIAFVYFMFAYASMFENNQNDLTNIVDSDVIPMRFVSFLMIQFVLLILDRVVYDFRSSKAKYLIQVVTTITCHVYIFFDFTSYVGRPFGESYSMRTWYLLMVVYFVLSALQIKYGYPESVHGHALMKTYTELASYIFLIYRAIPFAFELRTLIDWITLDTTLPLYDYFKVEDLYAGLYNRATIRLADRKIGRAPGDKQPLYIKLTSGVIMFIVLCLVLWFPLLLASFRSTGTTPYYIQAASVDIRIDEFTPLYDLHEHHFYDIIDPSTMPQNLFNEFNSAHGGGMFYI